MEKLKEHIENRVNREYPETEFGTDNGAVPQQILEMLEAGDEEGNEAPAGFDMKQATMPDLAPSETRVFESVRPTLVVDEGTSHGAFSKQVVAESAMSDKTSVIEVSASNSFENQFVSNYNCRVFPWALNYDCGGPDYPNLFGNWQSIEKNVGRADVIDDANVFTNRWRRNAADPPLMPGEYAKMLATRPEMQIAGDWMCVPSARNLHWRYEVLRSAFLVCKQKVTPGETLSENLDKLLASLEKIWQKISSNAVIIDKKPVPLNGHLGLLFSDTSIDSTDKTILRAYLQVTSNISGCQALRRRIGHILFGFRCVYGECLFVTVSPNRRHSSLILRLSRARVNDTGLVNRDEKGPKTGHETAYWRHRYASSSLPSIFGHTTYLADKSGKETEVEVPLPDWPVRQQWLAQDPLASVHYYLVMMRVVVAAAFGVRMCFKCPDCNADCDAEITDHESCSDFMGNNHKSMGGYAGIATAMAFANEFQGSEHTKSSHDMYQTCGQFDTYMCKIAM